MEIFVKNEPPVCPNWFWTNLAGNEVKASIPGGYSIDQINAASCALWSTQNPNAPGKLADSPKAEDFFTSMVEGGHFDDNCPVPIVNGVVAAPDGKVCAYHMPLYHRPLEHHQQQSSIKAEPKVPEPVDYLHHPATQCGLLCIAGVVIWNTIFRFGPRIVFNFLEKNLPTN